MIHKILPTIVEELNAYISRVYGFHATEKKVLLGNLIDQNGRPNGQGMDKVICSLVNIQKEQSIQNIGRMPSPSPPHLNISVLFAANFNDYITGLKLISGILAYFEGKPVFTDQNTPGLPLNTQKVTAEMVNLNTEELSDLWSVLGGKYLPGILYQFRFSYSSDELTLEELPQVVTLVSPPVNG
ncbi:MAG: DUF4255 domain-containing protein [Saprospiraceae bacterium]|nr:DUF4255 domain-containing protein [Saprospiraceae bacterium]MCB9325693.1 DUF4255 domain-containing protein [Lewinellaceae bacterium]